jgi:hypothetical protein
MHSWNIRKADSGFRAYDQLVSNPFSPFPGSVATPKTGVLYGWATIQAQSR